MSQEVFQVLGINSEHDMTLPSWSCHSNGRLKLFNGQL